MRIGGALVLAMALSAGDAALAKPPCAYDLTPALAMTADAFDQGANGWRAPAKEHCFVMAADSIARYRIANKAKLNHAQDLSLSWHEGQMRAAAGDYADAVMLFEYSRAEHDDGAGGNDYVDATIAFLRRDRPGLVAARDRMERLPEPAWFKATRDQFQQRYGRPLPSTWPVNHELVDSLVACFDRPYGEAYSFSCGIKPKP